MSSLRQPPVPQRCKRDWLDLGLGAIVIILAFCVFALATLVTEHANNTRVLEIELSDTNQRLRTLANESTNRLEFMAVERRVYDLEHRP